ncbi:regulator of RNase E activity RraA [Paenibacillus sp. DS2015]
MNKFVYSGPDAFMGVSTACVSDALDTFGINGGLAGLGPLGPGMSLVGPAYTLRFEEVSEGEMAQAGEYIDDVPLGSVIVIANEGRRFCTVWGDLLTHAAQLNGIRGTVIDGCCRDATAILKLDYPLFSVGTYMKSGKNRVKLVCKDEPIDVSGTVVNPGDIVLADDSGVVVIPKTMAEQVYLRVKEIEEMENNILCDLKNGVTMKQSRITHQYNKYALKTN